MVKKMGKLELLRKTLQILFVLYIFFVSLGHTFNWEIGESLHGICPFGAVETFHTWITTGSFIHHTGEGNVFIVVGLLLTLILVGAFFCGWICPFGTAQEFIGKIGRKVFGKKYDHIIPQKIDSALRYVKYIFLMFILFQTARSFKLVFENIDPYYTLFNIWSDEIAVSGYIMLAIALAMSLIVERPYCRYMCPLGAINGLFNFGGVFTLKRDEKTCISCKKCDNVCPVNIKVSECSTVNNTKCIRCMQCITACPVNNNSDTLKFKTFGKNGKVINKVTLLLISLVLFILPIIAGMATNSFEEDQSDKKYETANDIRGSYTIDDISNNYNISVEELVHAFNIEDNRELKLNGLLEAQGYSLETLRSVIGGLDKAAKETIPELPKKYDKNMNLKALIMSEEAGKIVSLLGSHEEEENAGVGIELKRKSMLVDIKDNVRDYKHFLETFDIPADTPLNTTFRELITEKGFEMSEVRDYVAEHRK